MNILLECLFVVVLIGLLPAVIASRKGYDFALWWTYGSVLFIVALPHSLIIDTNRKALEQRNLNSGEYKKCLFCAELVKREAIVCRYCQRDLKGDEHGFNQTNSMGKEPAYVLNDQFTNARSQLTEKAFRILEKAKAMGYKVNITDNWVSLSKIKGGMLYCYSNSQILEAETYLK